MSNTVKPRVFADFQNSDPLGRIRLSCVGTIEDLARQGIQLHDGLQLQLYDDGLEAEGVVRYSNDEGRWVAVIDWDAVVETNESGQ